MDTHVSGENRARRLVLSVSGSLLSRILRLLLGCAEHLIWSEGTHASFMSVLYAGTPRSGKAHDPNSPLPVTPATSPPWCPNGWVPHPSSGMPPQPPPDVGCQGLPCSFKNSTYISGGVLLFNVVTDPFERHNVATENPGTVLAWI